MTKKQREQVEKIVEQAQGNEKSNVKKEDDAPIVWPGHTMQQPFYPGDICKVWEKKYIIDSKTQDPRTKLKR